VILLWGVETIIKVLTRFARQLLFASSLLQACLHRKITCGDLDVGGDKQKSPDPLRSSAPFCFFAIASMLASKDYLR
jgi:hypothetical protein